MTLPAWNSAGVLPPIHPNETATGLNRAHYPVDLMTLHDRFATSADRLAIFKGFLRFRAALHAAGIDRGFQWVNGSFMEDIERLEGRSPRDLDVVTFFYLPEGRTQAELATQCGTLFDSGILKQIYSVDAFFMVLGMEMIPEDVRRIAYWHSLWSHRRDSLWKGFIQIDLSPTQDSIITQRIDQHAAGRSLS